MLVHALLLSLAWLHLSAVEGRVLLNLQAHFVDLSPVFCYLSCFTLLPVLPF